MITRSKVSHRPENKLTKKFRIDEPEQKAPTAKKNLKPLILLFSILILTSGGTFGVIYLVHRANSNTESSTESPAEPEAPAIPDEENADEEPGSLDDDEAALSIQPITDIASSNPTIQYGRLMLINPNFMVETNFIAARKNELISLSGTYGIEEFHAYNGDNLMDREAAEWLNKMLSDYTVSNPGHTMKTVSCFRQVGTSCGRLCMPTGASDHHTGLTCDLIDPIYGDSLDTDTYDQHLEWQWLKNNSYKYGFIDRFPSAWSGGPMSQPMNVDAEGSTGLYETWHYRYVGLFAANEIATGVYNNGQYDSLEHYLKARGLVPNLLNK